MGCKPPTLFQSQALSSAKLAALVEKYVTNGSGVYQTSDLCRCVSASSLRPRASAYILYDRGCCVGRGCGAERRRMERQLAGHQVHK
eukprot:scaffold476872_cov48-Prasinocladus_malaysianus.AAC.1